MYDRAAGDGDVRASVLICDDSDAIRELLRTVVSSHPRLHVAGEAADGNEAIREATRLQPAVILLDLAMPGLSGLEALPELRRVAPDAQILVFSGFAVRHVADHVIGLGATSCLEKGAHPDAITTAIEEALRAPVTRSVPV